MSFDSLQNEATKRTKKDIAKQVTGTAKILKNGREKIKNRVAQDYAKYELAGKSQVEVNSIMNSGVRQGKSRLDRLLADSRGIYSGTYSLTSISIQESSKTGISNQFYYDQYVLMSYADTKYRDLKSPLIDASVYSDAERLRKKYNLTTKQLNTLAESYFNASGKQLMKTLGKNRVIQTDRAISTVKGGITQGKSFREISKDIEKTFDISFNEALRIVRTESHRTLEAGNWTVFQMAKMQGEEGFRQIISTLDNRTREQSAAVDKLKESDDGLFHFRGKTTKYPGNWGVAGWDINDRETTIIRLEGIEPNQRRGTNPVTGEDEVITFQSFDEWAKSHKLRRNKFGRIVSPNQGT